MVNYIFRSKQSDKYEASLALQAPRNESESNEDYEALAMALVERNAERSWHDTDD